MRAAKFALLSLFLALNSASAMDGPPSQQVLWSGSGVQVTEDAIHDLLLAHNGDPVEVMRIIDPVYGATLDEPRLLRVFRTKPVWMTEGDKLRLRNRGLSFMDLTGREYPPASMHSSRKDADREWPPLRYQTKVHQIIGTLRKEEMVHNLGNLTSFYNRYYRSDYGAQSSRWIYNKLAEIIAGAPPGVHISLETFTHGFPQPSVIARFEPARGRVPNNRAIDIPHIILGAHQDSANYAFPFLPAPGADDDGSGTVTILEAFRALVQAGFRPECPVEFHWYAAEEGGLLGSQDIVSEYKYQRKSVGAMIQFDMTAYVPKGAQPNVTFITTDVTSSLTKWAMNMTGEYSTSPVSGGELPWGAGSDHMSWHDADFPAIFATEGDPRTAFNPWIHTAHDRMDLEDNEFSFEHALEFAKVAVGFAVELGGWVD